MTRLDVQSGYPRLLPHVTVLRRGPQDLQVGLDIDSALVLADPENRLELVLRLLDGTRHRRQIVESAARGGISADQVDWLLRTLSEAGLTTEAATRRSPSERPQSSTDLTATRVRLVGVGKVGALAGELLLRSGVAALYVVDPERPDAEVYPRAGIGATQAEAFRARAPSDVPGRVVVTNHWSKPESVVVDLTVATATTQEPDRVLLDGLVRMDQPHLVVRPRAGGVVVGPLVVPGQTSCLRCADLTRTDADPAWPTLLGQLSRTRCSLPDVLASWASAMVVTQTLAFVRASAAETMSTTLEIAAPDFAMRRRVWSAHPRCGCHWSPTAEWSYSRGAQTSGGSSPDGRGRPDRRP